LEPLCESVKRNKIRSITIPLLEKSDIKDRNVRREFINSIRRYSKKYKDIIFSFEFECEPKEILEVAKVSENFRITYDTGNITSFAGASAYRKYIKALIGRIDAIHLKDKSRNGTVFPGSGDTPFAGIFALLKTLKYDGPLTIQTARGRSGDELNTSVRHFKFFKKYL
jgi:sugar phosphate isomerase/epimerase